jgi:hypothetical protein
VNADNNIEQSFDTSVNTNDTIEELTNAPTNESNEIEQTPANTIE